MKRILISLLILAGIFLIHKDNIVIPKEALRIRVIAASDSKVDQDIKIHVKNQIENDLYSVLKNVKDIEEARNTVKENIHLIDSDIKEVLEKYNYTINYKIDFGYNYFPSKEYKGIKYSEGMYESLVITLGSGLGENWWCVMFPPFCLIEAHDNNETDIEYRWLVKDMLHKYFK